MRLHVLLLVLIVTYGCGDGGAAVEPGLPSGDRAAAATASPRDAAEVTVDDVLRITQPLTVIPGGVEVARFSDREVYFRAYHPGFKGPELSLTPDPDGNSGAYGLTLSRSDDPVVPLTFGFATAGTPQWEIGLDVAADACGDSGGFPDFVLAYDNSEPTGDRLRMAPGGYTQHSPTAGCPIELHRFHIIGGDPSNDRAENVLYLQSGSTGKPGAARYLLRGQGRDPVGGRWGKEVFGVTVDGKVMATGIEIQGVDLTEAVLELREPIHRPAAWFDADPRRALGEALVEMSRNGARHEALTYGDLERLGRLLLGDRSAIRH